MKIACFYDMIWIGKISKDKKFSGFSTFDKRITHRTDFLLTPREQNHFVSLIDLLKVIEKEDIHFEKPRHNDVVLYRSWDRIYLARLIDDRLKYLISDFRSSNSLLLTRLEYLDYFNLSSALRQIANMTIK